MSLNVYRWLQHVRALWPWLPLWLLVSLLAIFAHGPMPLYSTRTLAVAWDMWSHGQWLVPHLNGAPYSEKVPLLFWLIHAGWWAFGVNDTWPRVLEVAFGGGVLVLLAGLARRLFPDHPWVAKAAPWMWLGLSYAFLFSLQIMYDVLLLVWVLAALSCLLPAPRRQEPRWLLCGLFTGLGLLTKGPVMLLHVLFPWLLGPLWSSCAREHRLRWYGRGVLAMLLGLMILLTWAWPAGLAGGVVYRHQLFFSQTMARVFSSISVTQPLQVHAQPVFWYLLMLPLLLFPFIGWPRVWVALASLRRPLPVGLCFALCWVAPSFVVFSLVNGKQLYYLLPEVAGMVLLLCSALALLRERRPALAGQNWLGPWPLGVGAMALGLFMFLLPRLVRSHWLHDSWLMDASVSSRSFGMVFILLGLLLLWRGRGELVRLGFAGLVGTAALNMLFALSIWYHYDLGPTTRFLAVAGAEHCAIGVVGNYNGEFHFAARLIRPITEMYNTAAIRAFAAKHPCGLIVSQPAELSPEVFRYSLLAQPFRSTWKVVWRARTLAALRSGTIPPDALRPPLIYHGHHKPYHPLPL